MRRAVSLFNKHHNSNGVTSITSTKSNGSSTSAFILSFSRLISPRITSGSSSTPTTTPSSLLPTTVVVNQPSPPLPAAAPASTAATHTGLGSMGKFYNPQAAGSTSSNNIGTMHMSSPSTMKSLPTSSPIGGLGSLGGGGTSKRRSNGFGDYEQDESQSTFLRLCSCLNWLTLGAGGASIFANLIIISCRNTNTTTELIVRCYGMCFGLLVIIAELEWTPLFRYLAFMESWTWRGVFLIFVGSLLDGFQHSPDGLLAGEEVGQGEGAMVPTYLYSLRRIVGYTLIILGALYTITGLLCFRLLKMRHISRIKRRKLMTQEVETLQAQKHEIERLLADTESKLQHL